MSWFPRAFCAIAVAATAACGRSESVEAKPEALLPGAIWDGPVTSDDALQDEGFSFASTGMRKSVTIGALDEAACTKALKKHKIPHVKATGAPKIDQPIILTGPIDGVHFDTGRPYAERTIAKGDAIDCRLAIALVDLARVVKKHGITHVMVKSFHRPTQQILDPGAPLRHRIGFAIDIAGFKTKKGHELNVLADFHGKIGQQTCGTVAAKPNPDTKEARELWAIFCQVAATEAFDSGINPNYNASHFDHIHFDLTTDHPILFFP
ncbi:MAG: extensin family protein [Polyangiales bacterium]